MKPTEYERLISTLIDKDVDMGELCAMVEKRKAEVLEQEKDKKIAEARSEVAKAIAKYSALAVDGNEDALNFLGSDTVINEIVNALKEMEDLIKAGADVDVQRDGNKVKITAKQESKNDGYDAIKRWLNNNNKVYQF
jgi:DNA topoisomerase VI subunit B